MSTETEALIGHAKTLAAQGYYVFPAIVYETGRKQPLVKWTTQATTDPRVIDSTEWAGLWEDATNVAVACEPSGLVVVDIDPYDDEDEDRRVEGEELLDHWHALLSEHDDDTEALQDPNWAETGRSGVHIYLRADPSKPVTNSAKDIAACIDIRGVGGMVVVYSRLPDKEDLPEVPEWLYELAKRKNEHLTPPRPPAAPEFNEGEAGTRYGLEGLKGELTAIRESWDADQGEWNDDLNRSAYSVGQLVGAGQLDYDEAHNALVDLLIELGAPTDQYKTLDSGFASGYNRPREMRKTVVITDEALEDMANEWLTGSELNNIPPPRWLIPGWLEYDSVAQIYGESGVGKSFVALDLACRVSRGMRWPADGQADAGPLKVGYIAAEGVSGLAQRKKAWETAHGDVGDMRFYPQAIQIMSPKWEIAVEYLSGWSPQLIVIDTQARCTEGLDENLPKEMGKVYARLEELQRATGACVLLIHHTAKGGSTARGTNVIKAAINTEIMLAPSYGRIKVKNTKQKNAESADDTYFKLEDVPGHEYPVPKLSIAVPSDMADSVQGTNAKMLIRQFLQESPDVPKTTNEILEATGLSRPYFQKKIKEMGDANEVLRSSVQRDSRNQAAYLWNPPVGGE